MTTSPLRVLIADDELLARKRLVRLLGELPDIELAGECANGEEVLARLEHGDVDVLVLDIQMPGITGIEVKARLGDDAPWVVFATAHPEHAVQAFDVGAGDYILKPIDGARLGKALDRARAHLERAADSRSPAPDGTSQSDAEREGDTPLARLAVPTRKGVMLLDPGDVTHAVLEDELVTLHTRKGAFLTDFTLQDLQSRLAAARFERVHRRALLNLEAVERLEPLETGGYLAHTLTGATVEISRQSARRLRRRLGL